MWRKNETPRNMNQPVASSTITGSCQVLHLGVVEYQRAWELQKALAQARCEGRVGDLLLLLEHPHVYTLGRRGQASDVLLSAEELRALGVAVHQIDRGGETTYHGPGQLVGYGILDVKAVGGPVAYVRGLEQVILATLADYDIAGENGGQGTAGVWVQGAKIAAIGVKVTRGVTTHGFALNVAPDLSYFSHIVACGVRDAEVTSLERLLGAAPAMAEVQETVSRHWGKAFGCRMETAAPASLEGLLPELAVPSPL